MSGAVLVATLLHRVAAEADRLHERAQDLQFSTGEITEADGASIHSLQDLDRMTQDLAGLACYLRGLATETGPDWCVDPARALASVTLPSLASRLASDGVQDESLAGEVDLFDSVAG